MINVVVLTEEQIHKLMENIMYRIGFKMQAALSIRAPANTASLRNSIQFKIEENTLNINFDMNAYGKYVEFGTEPHWAPIGPLKEWARRVLGDENIAYAIQAKIAKVGTTPQPFIRITFRTMLKRIIEESINEESNNYVDI